MNVVERNSFARSWCCSHTGGKQAYVFLRFATQEKMYNYVQVSREKWGYVVKRRIT